jgi:hypothetical protein
MIQCEILTRINMTPSFDGTNFDQSQYRYHIIYHLVWACGGTKFRMVDGFRCCEYIEYGIHY